MPRHSVKDYDPLRLARLETEMWRVYYEHHFFRLFRLLLAMYKAEIHVSTWVALRMAYYSARSAVKFRRKEDKEVVKKHLTKLYKLIDRHIVEDIDSEKCAELELNWWLVHRYPKQYQQTLAEAIAEATATFHKRSPSSLSEYAELRAKAMKLRDDAVHVNKSDPDWAAIKECLERSYLSIHKILNS